MRVSEIASQTRVRIPASAIRAEDYVTTDNMRPNFGGIDASSSLPPSGNVTAFQEGDILLSNIRPYFRKTWLATHNGGCNADVLCIRADQNKCFPMYLYYLFTTDNFVNDYLKSCKGAKMPRGDVQRLLDYEFDLPDLPTQLRIAGVLGSLDEKIALNRKKIAELEALAKTIYDYWFVQFDFPDKDGKPYKSSGGKMVWNDQLKREVPKRWGVGKFREMLENLKDGTHNPPKRIAHGIPLLTGTMFGNMFLCYKDVTFISQDDYKSIHSTYQPRPRDVVMTKIGTLGKVNYLTKTDVPIAIHCNSALFQFNDQYKWPYSFSMCKGDLFQTRLRQCKGQSIQEFVSLDKVGSIDIELPDAVTVNKFNSLSMPIFESLENLRDDIVQLTEQRDTLLPLLMNGQVEVAG